MMRFLVSNSIDWSLNKNLHMAFIRNYGKYFFRLSDRMVSFSYRMEQKAASICSESGNFLLLFASASKLGRTISTHHQSARMVPQPERKGVRRPLGKQINWTMRS